MGIIRWLFGSRRAEVNPAPLLFNNKDAKALAPDKSFSDRLLTPEIKNDIRLSINNLNISDPMQIELTYQAALKCALLGGKFTALPTLMTAILDQDPRGMTKAEAEEIAYAIWSRARSLINRNEQIAAGFDRAIWSYSGASCIVNRKKPSEMEIARDAAHKAANGKKYKVAIGLTLNSSRTWPGREPGCKCVSRPVVLK